MTSPLQTRMQMTCLSYLISLHRSRKRELSLSVARRDRPRFSSSRKTETFPWVPHFSDRYYWVPFNDRKFENLNVGPSMLSCLLVSPLPVALTDRVAVVFCSRFSLWAIRVVIVLLTRETGKKKNGEPVTVGLSWYRSIAGNIRQSRRSVTACQGIRWESKQSQPRKMEIESTNLLCHKWVAELVGFALLGTALASNGKRGRCWTTKWEDGGGPSNISIWCRNVSMQMKSLGHISRFEVVRHPFPMNGEIS